MDIETIEEMEGDEAMKGITHYKGDMIIDSLKDNKTMKGKERITDHETIDSSKPMSMKGITHTKDNNTIDSSKPMSMQSITHTKDNNTIDSSKPTQTMTGNEQYQMMIH